MPSLAPFGFEDLLLEEAAESAFSGLLSGIEIEIEIEIGMETLMPARHDEVDQFVEYLTIWRWREVVERLPRFVREDMRLGK